MLEERVAGLEKRQTKTDRSVQDCREMIADLARIVAQLAERDSGTRDLINSIALRTDRLEVVVAENARQIAENSRLIGNNTHHIDRNAELIQALTVQVSEIGHKLDGLIDVVDGMIRKP